MHVLLNEMEEKMGNNFKYIPHDSTYISHDSILQSNTIKDGVKIYKQAEIRDSYIGEHVSIGDHSVIRESKIQSFVAINRRNEINRSIIGKNSYTGIGTIIRSSKIGKFCSISWYASIGGRDHCYNNVTTSSLWRFEIMDTGQSLNTLDHGESEECEICNDVWIGSNSVILRGVKVGTGAVIGAGSVVTKDVAPYNIVAGGPAEVLKKRFDSKTISTLLEISWWDWPHEIIRNNKELIFNTPVNESTLSKLIEISKSIDTKSK